LFAGMWAQSQRGRRRNPAFHRYQPTARIAHREQDGGFNIRTYPPVKCVALPAVAAFRPASDTRPETIFANSSRVRRNASAGSVPPLIVCFARIAGTYNAAIRSPPSDESPANDSGSANATGNSYCPVCTRTPPLAHTADSAALICDDVTATVTAGRWRSHDSEIAFGDTSDHAASATASASR